jgi:hypothetical protein
MLLERVNAASEYKELMIRPVLQTVSDTDAGTVSIANSGLGPAKINRVLFHSKDRCLDTDTVKFGATTDFKNMSLILRQTYMITCLLVCQLISTTRLRHFPPPPTVFFLQVRLFKFDPTDLRSYLAKLDKIPGEYRQLFLDNFAKRSSSLPIQIEYCSLSGDFCSSPKRPLDLCSEE